jgi:hypothetical protein
MKNNNPDKPKSTHVKKDKYDTRNIDFAENDVIFQKACELAAIKATTRQGSKWRNGKGKAFSFRYDAKRALKGNNNE